MCNYHWAVLAIAVVSIHSAQADMVYKCKNATDKVSYQKTPCSDEEVKTFTPKTPLMGTAVKEPPKKSIEPIVLRQGHSGHYFLNADVNSHNFLFVVDTGATLVSLPRAVAAAASMFCDNKAMMETANGLSQGCTSTITELRLGDFVFKNVTALIAPNLAQPLLGMNVLQGFDIQQKDGEMRLSQREAKH